MDKAKINERLKNGLSEEKIAQIRSDINYFLLNYPETEVKNRLWKLFSGWTYNIAEGGGSTEIAPMLLFYEQLLEVVDWLEQLS
jgi:hypothetical protein